MGHPKHQPAFGERAANDKIELQIRVDSVDAWADRLAGSIDLEGPVTRPWGNRYLWIGRPPGSGLLREAAERVDQRSLFGVGSVRAYPCMTPRSADMSMLRTNSTRSDSGTAKARLFMSVAIP